MMKPYYLNKLADLYYYLEILYSFFNSLIVQMGQKTKNFMKKNNRYVLINDRVDSSPYLERYYLFLKDRKSFYFNLFLHKFLKSDSEDLHDHPWSFISIPIYPGYWEHTINGKKWRGPLSIRYAPASQLHRVELLENYNYCWTIFIPLKQIKPWGFMTNNGWINHEEYLKQKKEDKINPDTQENQENQYNNEINLLPNYGS